MTTTQHGGQREGAGRPISPLFTKPVMLRLTEAQRLQYLELGGARWVKRLIEEAKAKNPP